MFDCHELGRNPKEEKHFFKNHQALPLFKIESFNTCFYLKKTRLNKKKRKPPEGWMHNKEQQSTFKNF